LTSACYSCRTALAALTLLASSLLQAQSQTTPKPNARSGSAGGQKARNIVLDEPAIYKRWPGEEVPWIISDGELSAWKKLTTNQERDNFIAAFWQRRNPEPASVENKYQAEYYRRIAYANEIFGAAMPGWRSDRGRVYILYGPPNSIESHPEGGICLRQREKGRGRTETYPVEVWRYSYLQIGQDIKPNVQIEFADPCRCGEYHLIPNSSEGDKLLRPPDISLEAEMESVRSAPTVKFKDLEEVINTKTRNNSLPFDMQVAYLKATRDTGLVPVIIRGANRNLTFVNKDGMQRSEIHILGRFTALTGRVVATFEDPIHVDIPAELMDRFMDREWLYWKALPLRWGYYRLDIVVKDVNGDKMGTSAQAVIAPYSGDKLANSTLLLSDRSQQASSRDMASGAFVAGATKIHPRLPTGGKPATFKRDRDSSVNLWMQVYNLPVDEKTRRASARIEYQVADTSKNEAVQNITESTDQMGDVGNQLTLQKSLPLATLAPGRYEVTIKISDLISGQKLSSAVQFAVE
jgi:GWxTD domain-containing protein